MPFDSPFDLLIECGGCGLENLISKFTPDMPAICNQCRENLLAYDLLKTHQGHICDTCERALVLKKETDFVDGESECQCGGKDFTEMSMKNFSEKVLNAKNSAIDDIEEDADFDWCRSAPDDLLGDDFNEVFDDDPGFR